MLKNKFNFNFNQFSSGVIIPILVVVFGVVGYFVLLPKFRAISATKADIATKNQQVSQSDKTLSDLKKLIDDYGKKKTTAQVIESALPSAPRIPELMANLDSLASQSGLGIRSISVTMPTTQMTDKPTKQDELVTLTDNLAIMKIDLSVAGKYINLKTFLGNLEQNLRLMDVRALTFDSVDTQSGVQDYELVINTYYQRE
ncbi:hypothetical protein D4R52_01500 [bacterium]|nr:MAG: hypothetical protein D4R52_01500 [bacterium]